MAEGPGLIRLALFGSPVAHSLSPRIHPLFASEAGFEIEYRAIECAAGQLAGRLAEFRLQGGAGCNITVPLKIEARALATHLSESARRSGAVNTLLAEEGGCWFGDNTDGRGLLRDLRENLGLDPAGTSVAILGAGGATAGVLPDLCGCRPARLVLANRTLERATELASRQPTGCVIAVRSYMELEASGPFDLVINATSLGHDQRIPPLTKAIFAAGGRLYDLNYGRAHEPLARWCEANGVKCHGGLGMLVEQAAASFHLWTGYRPRTAAVIRRLEQG